MIFIFLWAMLKREVDYNKQKLVNHKITSSVLKTKLHLRKMIKLAFKLTRYTIALKLLSV